MLESCYAKYCFHKEYIILVHFHGNIMEQRKVVVKKNVFMSVRRGLLISITMWEALMKLYMKENGKCVNLNGCSLKVSGVV